jgi:hypothetical protein
VSERGHLQAANASTAAAVAADFNMWWQLRSNRVAWSGVASGGTAHSSFIRGWDALRYRTTLRRETRSSPRLALKRSQAKAADPPRRMLEWWFSSRLGFWQIAHPVGHVRRSDWRCRAPVSDDSGRIIGQERSSPVARRCQLEPMVDPVLPPHSGLRFCRVRLQELQLYASHQLLAVDRGCHGSDRIARRGCGIVSDQASFPKRCDDRCGVFGIKHARVHWIHERARLR